MNPGRVYAESAISAVPRLLSMQDRNPYSPSYGCFDRMYWLDKAMDFPSSILQLNAHNLALVYSIPFEDNPYYGNENVLEWALAGIDYWTQIQNRDGSFDEFYPNERGWAGPTGFLLYSMLDSYVRLGEEVPPDLDEQLRKTAHDAADYLANNDEIGFLANHHAMALLPIYYASEVLERDDLRDTVSEKFAVLEDSQSPEGWLLEYDGVDAGYLSATVSFLGKLYELADNDLQTRILEIVDDAIEFSSHFVYPDGSYGGTVGSRQTVHFYPHGYRIFADELPIAGQMADHVAIGVQDGKMAPPSVMPWRYVGYRIQEYLLTAEAYRNLDTENSPANVTGRSLPCQAGQKRRYFEDGGIYVLREEPFYAVANLARGGVIKVFRGDKLVYNDTGIVGELDSGQVVTSQWVDDDYDITETPEEVRVRGNLHDAPFTYPTPAKNVAFRLLMLTVGQSTKAAYWLKGAIRRLFITNTSQTSILFERAIKETEDGIEIRDIVEPNGSVFERLSIGGEFSVRYVPQSQYFHPDELDIQSIEIEDQCPKPDERLEVVRRLRQGQRRVTVDIATEPAR